MGCNCTRVQMGQAFRYDTEFCQAVRAGTIQTLMPVPECWVPPPPLPPPPEEAGTVPMFRAEVIEPLPRDNLWPWILLGGLALFAVTQKR